MIKRTIVSIVFEPSNSSLVLVHNKHGGIADKINSKTYKKTMHKSTQIVKNIML